MKRLGKDNGDFDVIKWVTSIATMETGLKRREFKRRSFCWIRQQNRFLWQNGFNELRDL